MSEIIVTKFKQINPDNALKGYKIETNINLKAGESFVTLKGDKFMIDSDGIAIPFSGQYKHNDITGQIIGLSHSYFFS